MLVVNCLPPNVNVPPSPPAFLRAAANASPNDPRSPLNGPLFIIASTSRDPEKFEPATVPPFFLTLPPFVTSYPASVNALRCAEVIPFVPIRCRGAGAARLGLDPPPPPANGLVTPDKGPPRNWGPLAPGPPPSNISFKPVYLVPAVFRAVAARSRSRWATNSLISGVNAAEPLKPCFFLSAN